MDHRIDIPELGLSVTVDVSDVDNVPVVFVDTPGVVDMDYGPRIRLRLNDELVYGEEPC
jgi:hypothetical protein